MPQGRDFTAKDIEGYISTFRSCVPNALSYFLNGGCYDFFLILKSIFPSAEAWSDCDHVITRIGDRFYDVRGEIHCERHLPIDGEEEKEFLSRH